MVLLYVSIALTIIGIIFLVIGYSASASNDRAVLSVEKTRDSHKKYWVDDFSDHLIKLFSSPCPTCKTKTILAEGVKKELRTNESPIEDFFEYYLITTRSYHRYCPKCQRLFDDPLPMEEWNAEEISQNNAFEGEEPLKIVQIHPNIETIVEEFAQRNSGEYKRWNYQPDSDQVKYEKLLERLTKKAGKLSKLVVWGWVLIPLGIALFFFWIIQ
jgi:thiol-disulfide isomerase/thioredoxin